MAQPLLKIQLPWRSSIDFYSSFLIFKGEKILYSDIDGVAYLWTRTTHRIYGIPTGTSHSYYLALREKGVKHKITFSGSQNKDIFAKFVFVIDNLIKPFVLVNLLLDYAKNEKLEIATLTITPVGIYRKRTWMKPELISWDNYNACTINQGKATLSRKTDKGRYKTYPFSIASSNAVVLPAILDFLHKNNGMLNGDIQRELIERKTKLMAESTRESMEAINACAKCGEKAIEDDQKFCAKCGSSLTVSATT
jgi:hypothetical protein